MRGWSPRAGTIALVASVLVFVLLAARAWRGGSFSWDGPIMRFLDDAAPVTSEEVHVDPLVTAVTLLGALVTAGTIALLAVRRRVRAALFVPLAVGGAFVLGELLKEMVKRPSIEGEADAYSFPSGSATWAMATVAALALVAGSARLRRAVVAGGTLFLVGYDAVLTFEDWHYPSDVLAGWCLGVAWTVVAAALVFGTQPRAALPQRS